MSRWQFMKDGLPTLDPVFDDGLAPLPGEPDFSTDAVTAQMATVGADAFNYVSPSVQPELPET